MFRRLFRRFWLLAIVAGCGGEDTQPRACTRDPTCVGNWSPGRVECGPVERCVDGRCALPPALTGERSTASARLDFADVGFDVEIADDAFETSRGLMCRDVMAAGWGMLFDLGHDADHGFTTRNVELALDLVFLDRDWRVAARADDVAPEPPTLVRAGVPSRYVLEVSAGAAARVALGERARFTPP